MERFGEEQNSLIMAVEKTAHEKVDEIEQELQEYVNNSQKDLRNISKTLLLSVCNITKRVLWFKDGPETFTNLAAELFSL